MCSITKKRKNSVLKSEMKGAIPSEDIEFPGQGYCRQWIFWGLIKNNEKFL